MPFTEEETKGTKRNPVSDDLFIHRYGGEGPCEKSIRIELSFWVLALKHGI
jgi:hypothetical protein